MPPNLLSVLLKCNNKIKSTYCDESKKIAHNLLTVTANKNDSLIKCGSTQREAFSINPSMKVLGQVVIESELWPTIVYFRKCFTEVIILRALYK